MVLRFASWSGTPRRIAEREVEGERVDPLPQERGRDELAPARALAHVESRRDRGNRGEAGVVVAHSAALVRRVLARRAQHVRDSRARPEPRDVVGGAVLVGALEAVAGDGGVDQARVAREQALRSEADARETRLAHVGDEHVCAADELEAEGAPLGPREVEGDAALAPVVHLEDRVHRELDPEHRLEEPRRVADPGRLDLHHVGAPVREDPPRRRPRDPYAEFDDADALHRSHRASSRVRLYSSDGQGLPTGYPGAMPVRSARLRLRVSPGAARPAVVGRHGDAWKLCVAAPPERGRANEAALELLARTLGVAREEVRLVSGRRGRDKVVALEGLTQEEAERRLASAGRGRSA
jgi:hypothetical protein